MLKASIGHSIQEDGYRAGYETALMAGSNIKKPKLAMLYTSCVYDQEAVLKGVKSVFGKVPVIGCTSCGGVIIPDGVLDNESGFMAMMALEDKNMKIGVAASPKKGDARKLGQRLAMEAIENSKTNQIPNYFYMVASPKEEESYLKGIEDVIGRVPFFGGSAADNTVSGDWKIFCNDQVFSDGCAVAFFYTDKVMGTEYTGSYRETENVGIITKVEKKRKLVEINGKAALDQYKAWTGYKPKEINGSNLLASAILKPLGVKLPLGDVTVIRHPMEGTSDKAMMIGNDLAEGTAVVQMEATVDELISATKKAVTAAKNKIDTDPACYFLVHCGGRKVGIGDRIGEVYRSIKSVTKDKPFITVFTFGEYGYQEHSQNMCGGLMLSFTAMSEE